MRKTANLVKGFGAVALAASLGGAGSMAPVRDLYCSAQHVVEYYQALDESKVPAGFLERVTLSLALAKAEANGKTECSGI